MPTQRRKNILVYKIRLTLVMIVLIQFPHILGLITSQISSVLSEDVPQSFQDIDFTNVTYLDMISRKAMKNLHDTLDRDDDGNVSMSEGAKFIDREDFNSANDNLPGFATDKDGRITESEFWDGWLHSAVHNWTVTEMVDWLCLDVDLPQYAAKFKQYRISGAAMPILASNSTIVLSLVDGIKEHRLKIWLKAMEIVLCGYTSSRSSLLKDILVAVSSVLALGGVAYGFRVRRSAAHAVALMQETLNNLQKEMTQLDEEDGWMKNSHDEDKESYLTRREHNSSQSSLTSESSLQSRLNEVLEELTDTRMLLEQAEERLNIRRWTPPGRLITSLKTTQKVEAKLHEAKRSQAQKKVEQAKSQFMKMKKKSIFSSVQLIHSRQVDNFDLEVQAAKDLLREVQKDTNEYKKRWSELESICNCKFLTSQPNAADTTTRTDTSDKNQSSDGTKCKLHVNSDRYASHQSKKYGDTDSTEGLQMKVDEVRVSNGSASMKSLQSCPQLTSISEKRRSEPISNSSSLLNVRPASLHKSPSPIPEEGATNSYEKSRSLPNRHRSPKFMCNKDALVSNGNSMVSNGNSMNHIRRAANRRTSPIRTTSLGPSDVTTASLLRHEKKNASSRSLPELSSEETLENLDKNHKILKINNSTYRSEENSKSGKKVGHFGSLFKRKPKRSENAN